MKLLLTVVRPAWLENLAIFMKSISDCAEAQRFDRKRISEIKPVTEETLMNIRIYAYPEKNGDVKINCKPTADRFIRK